jgi:uncharacterized protein YbjT (DUF2867 family)
MENLLGMAGTIREGKLALPLPPDRKLQMIAVDDIGGFAALAFEHPQKWLGRALDIAGDETSMNDLAALLTRVLGREVRYEEVPLAAFESQAGSELASMWRWFKDVGYQADIPSLRQEYQRLTALDRWAQSQNWGAATRAAH